MNGVRGCKQATREHVLAVTRNFLSQPRISKCTKQMLQFFYVEVDKLLQKTMVL